MKPLTLAFIALGTTCTMAGSHFAGRYFGKHWNDLAEQGHLLAKLELSAHEFQESQEQFLDMLGRDRVYAPTEKYPAVLSCNEIALTLNQFIISNWSDSADQRAQDSIERRKSCEEEHNQSSFYLLRDFSLDDCLDASLKTRTEEGLVAIKDVLSQFQGLKRAYNNCFFAAWHTSSSSLENVTNEEIAPLYNPDNTKKCSQKEAHRLKEQAKAFGKEAEQKTAQFNSWYGKGEKHMAALEQQDSEAYRIASVCWEEVIDDKILCILQEKKQLSAAVKDKRSVDRCESFPLARAQQCLCLFSVIFYSKMIESSQSTTDCYQQILTKYSQCPTGITRSD